MSSNNTNRPHGKRNYHGGKNKSKYQPKRGGPGILITCESGRDFKAKREGIEIIRYYYNLASGTSGSCEQGTPAATKEDDNQTNNKREEEQESEQPPKKELSLEDELNQLKSENALDKSSQHHKNRGRRHGPFAVYDTGCKGTIFVMCTTPDCSLIPKLKHLKNDVDNSEGSDDDNDDNCDDAPSNKRPKTAQESSLVPNEESKNEILSKRDTKVDSKDGLPSVSAKWDPVNTIRSVMDDIQEELTTGETKPELPGSRFVSRMIPMQATCFASIEEITATFRLLLDNVVLPKVEKQMVLKQQTSTANPTTIKTISFGIKFKKRNCGNVTRDQVIEGIVTQIDEATKNGWKVNLDEPDYRVEVQICKTLCGMSILNASGEDAFMASNKFNLAELRVKAAASNENDAE